ncbi:MAG: histidine phosphatase family protein [Dethiobacteria bacterium]
MEIWLVRHAVTDANLEGRLQGRLEYPLSKEGRRQALSLARRLKKQPFYAFFSSDLQRTKETSLLISSLKKGPRPLYSPLLREYCFGQIQGLTKNEIRARYPLLADRLQHDFYHTEIPGAEGLPGLFRRVRIFYRFLSRLAAKKSCSRPVLVVSHGRFLQAFVIHFLKYDLRESWPFSFNPASLTILEGNFRNKKRLILFNDTCHLEGAGI